MREHSWGVQWREEVRKIFDHVMFSPLLPEKETRSYTRFCTFRPRHFGFLSSLNSARRGLLLARPPFGFFVPEGPSGTGAVAHRKRLEDGTEKLEGHDVSQVDRPIKSFRSRSSENRKPKSLGQRQDPPPSPTDQPHRISFTTPSSLQKLDRPKRLQRNEESDRRRATSENFLRLFSKGETRMGIGLSWTEKFDTLLTPHK